VGLTCIGLSLFSYHNMISLKKQKNVLGQEDVIFSVIEEKVGSSYFIEEFIFDELSQVLKLDRVPLMLKLVSYVKKRALVPTSGYYVGAVGFSKSGRYYFCHNMEFAGFPLNNSIHSEQFLIANVLQHGDVLTEMAISAAPCGHCRQFMVELCSFENLKIHTPDFTADLSSLLVFSFGPQNLKDIPWLLSDEQQHNLKLVGTPDDEELAQAVLNSTNRSYSHYTNSHSAVAIRTRSGQIYSNIYIESVAYNPTLSPIHTALISLTANNETYEDITDIALMESQSRKIHHKPLLEQFAEAFFPSARKHYFLCE